MNIKKNKSLKELNTFGVDSLAEHFLKVTSHAELVESMKYIDKNRLKYFVLGGGSNILLGFNKYKGAVVYMQTKGVEIVEDTPEYETIECAAGVDWDEFVEYTVERGLGGIENMSLIPGTVGASPIQNIGAYGQELKDSFESAKVYLTEEKKTVILKRDECNFDYRDSIFKRELKGKSIIVSVSLKLKKNPKLNYSYKGIRELIFVKGDEKPTLRDMREAVIKLRTQKLPDPKEIGNAGSFFKNPEITEESYGILKRFVPEIDGFKTKDDKVKISAAKLIELSGWKGRREGNCGVYKNHSLVLVNYGGATGGEIVDLAHRVIDDVYQKFGIKLTVEVNLLQ
ncbi:MAG: UDP-N-acetylmuramate dehydrogenase [Ignavibacteriaceae bacterium]|jgi:UDP-N-acetylmuramate dehydrogenase|nr:UDP-N-acetylmuramate dehydrogenase [Ignavibacteriaceae bacterium]